MADRGDIYEAFRRNRDAVLDRIRNGSTFQAANVRRFDRDEPIYRRAFDLLCDRLTIRSVRFVSFAEEPELQRRGVDYVLETERFGTVHVDGKLRPDRTDDDMTIEYIEGTDGHPGFIEKPNQLTDVLVYAQPSVPRAWVVPMFPLRRAWRRNKAAWIRDHPRIESPYTGNVSVAVPIDVLRRHVPIIELTAGLEGP